MNTYVTKNTLNWNRSLLVRLSCLLLSTLILSSCAAVVVGGAAMVASDRRTTGTVLDDQNIEIRVVDHIYSAEGFEGDRPGTLFGLGPEGDWKQGVADGVA